MIPVVGTSSKKQTQKSSSGRWLFYGFMLLHQFQLSFGAYGTVVTQPGECRDVNGKKVEQDSHYVPPGSDTCRLCVCDNGHPKACKAVLCSPPHDCKSFQIGSSCLASGVIATFSLTLLFFVISRLRHRKSRAQECREVIDDPVQRNIANNVGYLNGSIGYIGSGTMNMDYSYVDHSVAPHYQLWKPPGAYYSRGEAPPPYEEAIAITSNEPLGSCTVSVATSTGRTLPISIGPDIDSNVPSIMANTTNLINININGSSTASSGIECANIANVGTVGHNVATITTEEIPLTSVSTDRASTSTQHVIVTEIDENTIMRFNDNHKDEAGRHCEINNDGAVAAFDCEIATGSSNIDQYNCKPPFETASELCRNSSCEMVLNSSCSLTQQSSGPESSSRTSLGTLNSIDTRASSSVRMTNQRTNGVDPVLDTDNYRQMAATVGDNSHLNLGSFAHAVPASLTLNDDMITNNIGHVVGRNYVGKCRYSEKKYHRTIPRQFSIVDPITNPIKVPSAMYSMHNASVDTSKHTSQRIKGPVCELQAAVSKINVANTNKICHCPIPHRAMTSYQAASSTIPEATPCFETLRHLRPTSDVHSRSQGRDEARAYQSSDHLDNRSANNSVDRVNSQIFQSEGNFMCDRSPIAKGSSGFESMPNGEQRYHTKELSRPPSTLSGTFENESNKPKPYKQPQQQQYLQLRELDHSYSNVDERKIERMSELQSRLNVRCMEKERDLHPVVNSTCTFNATIGTQSNPILPPKIKKQLKQSQLLHVQNGKTESIKQKSRSSSLVHVKQSATANHASLAYGHSGNSDIKDGKIMKINETKKSSVEIQHNNNSGTLLKLNSFGSAQGCSSSLPRQSFMVARNYEKKRSNDHLSLQTTGDQIRSKSHGGISSTEATINKKIQERSTLDCNTLPKNGIASVNRSSRKTNLLTEAVNHIPSVINIPTTPKSSFGKKIKCIKANIAVESVAVTADDTTIDGKLESQTEQRGSMEKSNKTKSSVSGTNSSHIKPTILSSLPVAMTTIINCANPREHALPNDNSLDDDYLSECENCKSSGNTRYYLELENDSKCVTPVQETMTLQRKVPDTTEEEQPNYYRVSSTLPSGSSKRIIPAVDKDRIAWFSTIPASSSSDDDEVCESQIVVN